MQPEFFLTGALSGLPFPTKRLERGSITSAGGVRLFITAVLMCSTGIAHDVQAQWDLLLPSLGAP